MGDTRKPKKQYESPAKRWDKQRIEQERKIKETYGLKNKKELRRIQLILKKKRENAKKLLAQRSEVRAVKEKGLLESLSRLGILPENSTLNDVLGLTETEFLERRLQTIALRKGFAKTPIQARQFITHGHIAIKARKITAPGYLVPKEDEYKIGWFKKPMEIEPPKPVKNKFEGKKSMQNEFENAKPKEAIEAKKEAEIEKEIIGEELKR